MSSSMSIGFALSNHCYGFHARGDGLLLIVCRRSVSYHRPSACKHGLLLLPADFVWVLQDLKRAMANGKLANEKSLCQRALEALNSRACTLHILPLRMPDVSLQKAGQRRLEPLNFLTRICLRLGTFASGRRRISCSFPMKLLEAASTMWNLYVDFRPSLILAIECGATYHHLHT